MFVFTGMIIWIATQGCVSPVCITLYVICSMSLVYFIYCCGCVEYSKTYWKACLTTNKNWRIYNRDDTTRSKIKVSKVISVSSDGVADGIRKTTDYTSRAAMSDSETSCTRIVSIHDINACNLRDVSLNMTGSTTMISSPVQVVCTQPNRTSDLSGAIFPVIIAPRLFNSGSVSLLSGDKYSPQSSPCSSRKPLSRPQSPEKQGKSCEYPTEDQDCTKVERGVTNDGYHDTQLWGTI